MDELASSFLSAVANHAKRFDDSPGKYQICQPTRVTAGEWMECDQMGCNKYGQDIEEIQMLHCNDIVEVIDVQFHIETNRVRAQISNPKGWISIRDVWTHIRWAVKIGEEDYESNNWQLTQNCFHFQASYGVPDGTFAEHDCDLMVTNRLSGSLGSDWFVHVEQGEQEQSIPSSDVKVCVCSVDVGSIVRDFKRRCVLASQRGASRYAANYPWRGIYPMSQNVPEVVRKRLHLDFSGATVNHHLYGFERYDKCTERTDVVVLKCCLPGLSLCSTCQMLRSIFNDAIESKVREIVRDFRDIFASNAPSSTVVCQKFQNVCADEMAVQLTSCLLKAKLSLELGMNAEVWKEDYKYPLGSEKYMDTDEIESEIDDGLYVRSLPGDLSFEGFSLWVSVVFVDRILQQFDEACHSADREGGEFVQVVDVPFGCQSTGGSSSSAWGNSEPIPEDSEGQLYKITSAPMGKFDGHPLGFVHARSLCLCIGQLMDNSFHFEAGHYGGKPFRYEIQLWDRDLESKVSYKDRSDYFVEVLRQDIEKLQTKVNERGGRNYYLERLTRYCVELKRGQTPPASPRCLSEDSWRDDYE